MKLTNEQRERLRACVRDAEDHAYSRKNFRQWRKFFLGTIGAILLCIFMEFGNYLPFLSNDAYTLRTCTLVAMRTTSGKSAERRSIYEDDYGNRYEIPASRKDYKGRQTELYTLFSSAHRVHYEVPYSLAGRILTGVVLVVCLGVEVWWYVQYREYQGWVRSAEKLLEEKT